MMLPWGLHPMHMATWLGMHPGVLRKMPSGGFPVPEALNPDQLPPAVKASMTRILEGPPKPAVTLAVMNEVQASMIAPDFPFRVNV